MRNLVVPVSPISQKLNSKAKFLSLHHNSFSRWLLSQRKIASRERFIALRWWCTCSYMVLNDFTKIKKGAHKSYNVKIWFLLTLQDHTKFFYASKGTINVLCMVTKNVYPGFILHKNVFYNSKYLNCIGALSFFEDLFTHFHDFWSQFGVVILVTPKQEVERKSEWFCGVKLFRSKFKVEWENGVWTKIRFLAGGFCSHAAISLWFLLFFFGFLDRFFSKAFSHRFIVHSMPSFLF